MLQAAACKDEIVAFTKQATQDWGDSMAREPCLSLAKEAQEWLDKVATLDDELPRPAPVTPRAIADACEWNSLP